jgi:tRNA modification GTPase
MGSGVSALPVSALRGDGMDELRAEIGRLLIAETEAHGAELLALSARQRTALQDAHAALLRAIGICRDTAQTSDRAELISIEIREAMNALSLLTGEIATEELLGRIFSRFCIGK